jgi:hypothetical protein
MLDDFIEYYKLVSLLVAILGFYLISLGAFLKWLISKDKVKIRIASRLSILCSTIGFILQPIGFIGILYLICH